MVTIPPLSKAVQCNEEGLKACNLMEAEVVALKLELSADKAQLKEAKALLKDANQCIETAKAEADQKDFELITKTEVRCPVLSVNMHQLD